MESVIATKNNLSEIKNDLREMELRLRCDTLKFTVWAGVAVILALGSMIAKGFHWL